MKDYNLLTYCRVYQRNISPTSTVNSEAYTSESPAKIDEITPGTTCTVIHKYTLKVLNYSWADFERHSKVKPTTALYESPRNG